MPPPPPFGWSPSPATFHCAGADKRNRSRDAIASEFCCTTLQGSSPPRGQAKRRKAHANHLPRSINKRCRLLIPRARLRAISGRARLPALRPRLSPGLPSLLSSRPCFLGFSIGWALPVLSCPSAVAAPHASAVVPKGMMPGAAPARVASPRGSTALAPHFRSHPECVPHERDFLL